MKRNSSSKPTGPPGWGLEEIRTTGCDGLPDTSQDTRMNVSGESRKETNDRKMEVLSAKTKTNIGFWNVRTMYEAGKLAQVTAESYSRD